MGGQLSNKGKVDGAEARREIDVPEHNGLILNGVLIPQEVLEVILSYCDLASLKWIRLVCSEWTLVTRRNSFFKAIYDRHAVPWSSIPDHIKSSDFSAALLYVALRKNGFRDNMVLNPSGEHGLQHWNNEEGRAMQGLVVRYMKTESPPVGCDALPTLPNSCFASSYVYYPMNQNFNLGLSQEIVNLLTPFEVRFSVMTAARFDCGGVGILQVDETQNTVALGSGELQPVNKLNIEMNGGETQWMKYSFAAYFPAEKKYVAPEFIVSFGAKDTSFWAGHYGLKFSHIQAVLKPLSAEEVANPEPQYPRTEMEGVF